MSDQPINPVPADIRPPLEGKPRVFLEVWEKSFSSVLGQIAGTTLSIECSAEAAGANESRGENDIHFTVSASGALRGEMSLRFSPAVALALSQLFMGETQNASAELDADHREAMQELLRQVAGQAATALTSGFGEVQLHLETSTAPSWSSGASGWLIAKGEGAPCRIEIEWQLSAALNASLIAPAKPAEDKPPDPVPQTAAKAPDPPANNLGLLLDVQLNVVLRFGERKMLLREILDLGAGSVVELDRRVAEPVDLLLDNRLVARGEVVVVDGNYGLRVLELATSPA
jgi:flagellar motor switch protein FliN/FliY